jgi:hypothetical protein
LAVMLAISWYFDRRPLPAPTKLPGESQDIID